MITLEDLKNKPQISRSDIVELLKSIGSPGENQDEKIKAVQELKLKNRQKYGVEETLHTYSEY